MKTDDSETEVPKKGIIRPRGVVIVFGAVVLLIFISWQVLFIQLNRAIQDTVTERTRGLYQIEYQDYGYSFSAKSFYLKDLNLRPVDRDKLIKSQGKAYAVMLPQLGFKVGSMIRLLFYGELNLREIHFIEPHFEYDNFSISTESGVGFETGQLHGLLSGFIQSLEIERFNVDEMRIQYRYLNEKDTASIEINSVSVELEDVFIDSTAIEMQDRFLFADHLRVLIKDESFHWNGEANMLKFDALTLSSSGKYVQLSNARWVERDSNLIDTVLNIHVPQIRIGGIDFLKFYQQNELYIDTFLVRSPILEHRNKSTSVKSVEEQTDHPISGADRIGEILSVVPVFRLNLLTIYDFNIDYELTDNERFKIDQLNLIFSNFSFDSTDTVSKDYFPRYADLELVLNDPEFSTSDTSWNLKASLLSYKSRNERIQLNKVQLNGNHIRQKGGDIERSIVLSSNLLTLNGFDLKKTVQNQIIKLESMNFDKPDIVWETGRARNRRSSTPNASGAANISLKGVRIDSLIYTDGSIEIRNSTRKDANGRISYFEGYVLDVDLAEGQTISIEELLDQRIFFQMGSTRLGLGALNHLISSRGITINTITGEYGAKNFVIESTLDSLKPGQIATDIRAEEAFLSCQDLRGLITKGNVSLKDVMLRGGILKVRMRGKEETEDKGMNSKLKKDILVDRLSVSDMDFYLQKDGNTTLKLSELDAFGRGIRISPRPEDSSRIHLYTSNLTIGFKDLFLPLENRKQLLTTESFLLSQDSNNLIVNNLSLIPNPTYDLPMSNTLKMLVPELRMEGILIDSGRLGLRQDLGKVWVSRPSFAIRRTTSSPSGFRIPERISGDMSMMPFDTLSFSDLFIEDGQFDVYTSNDTSFAHIGSKDINLNASGFTISPSSSWSLDRILWFNDLSFNASDIILETSATNGCQEIDSIEYHFDPNLLTAHGIYYSEAPVYRYGAFQKPGFSVFAKRLEVVEPQMNEFIRDRELNIRETLISGALLEVELDRKDGGKTSIDDFRISRKWKISDSLNAIRINKVKVRESAIDFKIHTPDRIAPLEIGSLTLDAEEFLWKPGEKWDTANIFYTANINLSAGDIYTTLDSGLMEMNIGEANVSTSARLLSVRNVRYVPTVFRYEFAKWKGRQSDVFNINLQGLTAHLNYAKLLEEKSVFSRSFEVNGLDISVLKDKRVPEVNPKIKPLYGSLIKKLPVTLDIREARARNMKVRYEEFAENGIRPGYVNINHVQIYASNVTNDSVRIATDSNMIVSGQGSLMNEGHTNIQVDFNLASPDDEFYMTATVGRFDAVELNKYIEPVGFIQLQSGELQSMNMYAFGNDNLAIGRMGLYYNDLRIKILDEETMRSKGLGAALRNAVGNTIVKSKNKYRRFKRRKPIYFERNKNRSFLNYMVKIALSGASTNIGLENYKRDIKKAEDSENSVTVLDERTIRKAEKKASKEYKKRRRKEKKGKSID
ncbi:MAG TPA: hypothetical protein DDX92_08210 [Flavobacteriales bacterium]|jgi:hypothetical protein|nr:hypothetical protein [Flavobacteriales bacterium]